MNKFITNIMNKYGFIGILFLIMLENLFPPIPSEVILTLAGFITTKEYTTLTIISAIISSTLGSVFGALILYYIGYKVGIERLIKLSKTKIGKILNLKEKDIINSKNKFNKSGNISVLYSRFIPIIRSLISIPAGINKMNIKLFIIYTLIGSIIWNTILIYLGKIVGNNYMIVVNIYKKYSNIILIILIIIIILKIIKKYDKLIKR